MNSIDRRKAFRLQRRLAYLDREQKTLKPGRKNIYERAEISALWFALECIEVVKFIEDRSPEVLEKIRDRLLAQDKIGGKAFCSLLNEFAEYEARKARLSTVLDEQEVDA